MIGLVLDASVFLKWFRSEGEAHVGAARSIRAAFHAGRIMVLAPNLLTLELVNVAGRRWGWDEGQLTELVESIDELGITWVDPEPTRVAHWTARGLTAHDATYVALAEGEGVRLVTDDDRILALAPAVAAPLSGVDRLLAALADPASGDEPSAFPKV